MCKRVYTVEITKFKFPEDLDDKKADFRLQVDVRHKDEKGDYATITMFLPSVDEYWECSKDENQKGRSESSEQKDRKYHLVRKYNVEGKSWYPEVDMDKVGPWGRRFRISATQFYELRVTVFDVEQKNWLDKLSKAVGEMFQTTVDTLSSMGGIFKPIIDETAATLGRRMSGSSTDDDTKTLFVHSGNYNGNEEEGHWSIKHVGYEIEFTAKIVPE